MSADENRLIRDDSDEAAQAPRPVARAKPTPTRKPRSYSSSGGSYPGRRQVNAYIEKQLFLWLKSISAKTDKPMVEIFEEALQAYAARFIAQEKFGQQQ